MGDSTCLMHGLSYVQAIPNHSKQGNPMHVLGESISFGRFMSEPLSWDKWSTFPHKKYVEEAARYAQPGSVAAKKAFFEAHYKRMAAQKAAALLDQQNASKAESEEDSADDNNIIILDSEFDTDKKMEVAKIQDDVKPSSVDDVITGNLENQDTVSCSEGSGSTTPQMERPLLKNSAASEETSSVMIKKKSGISSLKSSIRRKTWEVPPTPAKTPHIKKENNATQSTRKCTVGSMYKKISSPKSLRRLINSIPIKDPDKKPVPLIKKDNASSGLLPCSSRTPKDCRTPLRTPTVVAAATKGVVKHPASTPQSQNRGMKTPIDPSALGTKAAGPKWHILSAVYSKSVTACPNKLQSPTLSTTPFTLRTEERAAKRKQKLEEKFNANEAQKSQLQKILKEKAGNELRKLSYSFCFKARPLPDFYKEREASINQMKTTRVAQPQTAVLGRSNSNKKQGGTVLMPPPPPPPKPFAKNGGVPKNLPEKKVKTSSKFLSTPFPKRITRENKSPNIQRRT